MVDRTLTDLVRRYLLRLDARGLPAPFGVVFGSTARGAAGDWSDIDLLVVSPRFDGRPVLRDVFLLWRVAAEMDSRIEPIACGVDQWEHDGANVIVEVARREGRRIDATGRF